MTEFPPSRNQEHPQAPFESPGSESGSAMEKGGQIAPGKSSIDEDVAPRSTPADALAERLLKRVPPLITDGGAEEEPEACPPIFDEEAWTRIEPRGIYARLVRPIFNDLLLGVLLIPVMAVVGALALANWIAFRDRSKVFFKQTRIGYRDQEFELWKFRTMRESSLSDYESWVEGNEHERVTWFGSFLRRSHLDELPQIINILKGEMSLIGPRPEMVDVNQDIQAQLPNFYRRLCMRPGITGFAQITQGYAGNDVHAYRRKLDADLVYIGDLTLHRDIGILLVTPFWMLRLLGWKNDPAAKRLDDVLDDQGSDAESGVIHPMPRPGVPTKQATRVLEEIDPIPPV